jgi:hypothetical protein
MFWRTLAGMGLLLATAPAAPAKSYSLIETTKPGDCFRVKITMKLDGEMYLVPAPPSGRPFGIPPKEPRMTLKLTATADHEFAERVLVAGQAGLIEKAAHAFERAQTAVTVDKDKTERALRKERQLIVCQRHKDQPLVYCPAGPLFRSELELASEHLDTLSLPGLLPTKPVALGDTWKVPNTVVQALCGFEGLIEHDLTCKLEGCDGKLARVSVTGKVKGIDVGALVKLTVTAHYHFDVAAGRLVWLKWTQKDEREPAPASPASSVEATTTLTRTAIATPASLADLALVPVPDGFEPPARMLHLDYQDPKNRYNLLYSRQWHIVAQTEEHLLMRLMDRGDFVAQVTVTPWAAGGGDKAVSPEVFKDKMSRMRGWQPEHELQAGEVPTEKGRKIYRLSCAGTLDGLEVIQNFYHVAHEDGRQVVLAFTMTPKQAERLGTRDLSLVGSLDFPVKK